MHPTRSSNPKPRRQEQVCMLAERHPDLRSILISSLSSIVGGPRASGKMGYWWWGPDWDSPIWTKMLVFKVVADIVLDSPILAKMLTSLELDSLKIGNEVFQNAWNVAYLNSFKELFAPPCKPRAWVRSTWWFTIANSIIDSYRSWSIIHIK